MDKSDSVGSQLSLRFEAGVTPPSVNVESLRSNVFVFPSRVAVSGSGELTEDADAELERKIIEKALRRAAATDW